MTHLNKKRVVNQYIEYIIQDDRDSFSMSMTDFLPLGDDENYSIGSIPRSKSKKIHHSILRHYILRYG